MGKDMSKPMQFFVFLLNCTWGIVQTLIGLIGFLWFFKRPHYWYKGSIVTVVSGSWGGISLGAFIFLDTEILKEKAADSAFVNHEHGHSLQSALLGPLYLILIGLPSLIWAGCFKKWRAKRNKSYYSLYCEAWADKWGGVKRDQV